MGNPPRLAGICLIASLVLAPATAATAARRRPAPTPAGLAGLVRAYRQAPTAAKLAAIKSYAATHPKQAPQARLALGVVAYEQKDFAAAIANLRQAGPKLPRIADYAAYYLAASRVEMNDVTGVARDLAPVYTTSPVSPLAGKSWLVEARALKAGDAAGAVRVLRDHYAELPQPEGDVTLADCYQAAGDPANAVDFYQRIYSLYVTGDAAARAAAALATLKAAMGTAYPEPLPQQALRRAGRLLDAQLYSQARDEFQTIANQAPEPRPAVSALPW